MKINRKQVLFISVMILIFTCFYFSCKKKEQYPIIPLIEFKEYFVKSSNAIDSSVLFIFTFKDGDGDIGYPDDDTLNKSVHVYYYKKSAGVFNLRIGPEDPFNFDVKLPMILAPGVKRSLKGDIEYSLDISKDIPTTLYDTIYVAFTLEDRAKNLSNIIQSPEIILKRKP